MPRPKLGAKPESPIVPVAMKLKELGYDPIWLYAGKGKQVEGWNKMPNEPDDIRKWRGKSVALRMNGHDALTAFDMDVPRQDILDSIIEKWTARWPEFMAKCLIRHSSQVKVMLIGRMLTERKRMYSARYGKTETEPGGNRVEVFTSNDSQYIGVWGVHSKGRDYGYDGPEITEVGYSDLPWFLEADLNELLTIANEVMEAAGLEKCEDAGADLDEAAFDLEPGAVAELKDGRQMTLTELEDECHSEFVYVHGRLFDPGSDSYRLKCKVTSQGLTIWDWGTGITHYWKHLGPQPAVLAPLLLKLAADAAAAPAASFFGSGVKAQVKAANARAGFSGLEAPPYPPDGADSNTRLLWLGQSYGYCALNDTVVDLFEASMECELKPSAFVRRFAGWYDERMRGNVPVITPVTDRWSLQEHRIHVAGVRMHPGQEFPFYREYGKLWKNVYQRPVHVGAGDLAPFTEFFRRFIPAAEEREWLLKWMAHKQARPDIPGSAVIFVADDDEDDVDERVGKFGTGRGLFFKIAHKLFGPQYARAQSFSIIDGSSSQATYNSWLHGNVLVTVDESKTSATAHRRGERKSVYEVLKDVVDPAPKGHTFNVKYGRAFWGYSYCSFWLATNHADALSIPPADRRFTVLRNGLKMTPEEGRELAAWLEVPGNIAELSRMLETVDLAGFNMFQHLDTAGKQAMIEKGRSVIEDHLIELAADETRGLVFTRQQLEQAIEDIVNPWERRNGTERRRGNRQWHGEFAASWTDHCVGLKGDTGTKIRLRVGGRPVKLYCFRKRRVAAAKLEEAARRAQALKWGPLETLEDGVRGLKVVKGSQEKDE